MKLQRSRSYRHGRIEIIPMIDVMFFLLVTFMLASLSMQSLNSITVNLPQGNAENLQHKEPVTLTITKDSQLLVTPHHDRAVQSRTHPLSRHCAPRRAHRSDGPGTHRTIQDPCRASRRV